MTDSQRIREETALTLLNLIGASDLTHLTMPEMAALADEVARLLPAGNVPSMVAASLLKSNSEVVSPVENRRNLTLLMQGMQTFMERATYNVFYNGPASILRAYQLLLKLTGKDPSKACPDGTLQFYVEFGLREDTGRHGCETVGFHRMLQEEQLTIEEGDALGSWLSAASWVLSVYPDLLAAEWMERVQLRHFSTVAKTDLLGDWIRHRPYTVPSTETRYTEYLRYRTSAFQRYYLAALERLPPPVRTQIILDWEKPEAHRQRAQDLATYQQQMTIRAMLTPGEFNDARHPINPSDLCIGVIYHGRYYLVQALQDHRGHLPLSHCRLVANTILYSEISEPTAEVDSQLSRTRRSAQPSLRRLIPAASRTDFEALRHAPVLINWDVEYGADQPVSLIRQGRRGVGDHALTIFRTESSFVFDLSHIFFDGPWGLEVAEILTGQATRNAQQVPREGRERRMLTRMRPLHLVGSPELAAAGKAAALPNEVSAESTLSFSSIQKLRSLLIRRNAEFKLTVNDLLLLYRSLFGSVYHPAAGILTEVGKLERNADPRHRKAAEMVRQSLEGAQQDNPYLLVPMDATSIAPRERIFPTTFRNPFTDLLTRHRHLLELYHDYRSAPPEKQATLWPKFDEARRDYLGTFVLFNNLMINYKSLTMQGESVSTSTIKLLAGLPNNVKRLLDGLPDKIGVVNDVIKGQEVFSNVGRVSIGSSLRRFITAKDDNEKKTLAWGIMTDDADLIHLSLRDFRPHVTLLTELGKEALARRITQDYLDQYTRGLNHFVDDLNRIIALRSPAKP